MNMMDFVSNDWFISFVSGITVYVGQRIWERRKENRELLRDIQIANQEVLQAIRPHISEGLTPERPLIDSLLSSTSKKYGLQVNQLYSINEVVDELVKEVLGSSFISVRVKNEFCNTLTSIKTTLESNEDVGFSENVESHVKQRGLTLTPVLLLLFTVVTSISAIMGELAGRDLALKVGAETMSASFVALAIGIIGTILFTKIDSKLRKSPPM